MTITIEYKSSDKFTITGQLEKPEIYDQGDFRFEDWGNFARIITLFGIPLKDAELDQQNRTLTDEWKNRLKEISVKDVTFSVPLTRFNQ